MAPHLELSAATSTAVTRGLLRLHAAGIEIARLHYEDGVLRVWPADERRLHRAMGVLRRCADLGEPGLVLAASTWPTRYVPWVQPSRCDDQGDAVGPTAGRRRAAGGGPW